MTPEESVALWYTKFPPLTPWFEMAKDPAHIGVYMVDQSREGLEQPVFSFWDGGNWYPQDSRPDLAMRWVCYGPIKGRFRRWRGLQDNRKEN